MTSYECDHCDFKTTSKHNYNAHIATKKHQNNVNGTANYTLHCPHCLKGYHAKSALFTHKKTCDKRPTPANQAKTTISQAFFEIKEMLSEIKNKPTQVTNQVINNTTNKMNVNVFLNENAKQAVDISDLLNDIQVDRNFCSSIYFYSNYAEKFGDEIKKRFERLNLSQRPIHCVEDEDTQQTIFQVRHNNEWVEECEKDVYRGIVCASTAPLETEFQGKGMAKYLHEMDRSYLRQLDEIYQTEYQDFKDRINHRFTASSQDIRQKFLLVEMIMQMAKNDMEALTRMEEH